MRFNYYDFFLSHSLLDKQRVLALRAKLLARGYRVCVDWLEFPHDNLEERGDELASSLKIAMRQSRYMIYLHSNHANQSRWCAWELGFFEAIKPECLYVDVLENTPMQGYIKRLPRFEMNSFLDDVALNVDALRVRDMMKHASSPCKTI